MSREIKFRGKKFDDGEWLFGNLIGKDVIVGEIVDWDADYFATEFLWKIDPATVGQFTGMLDKNGKEIFDGDIVKSQRGYSFVVEWTDDGRFLGRTANRSIAYVGQEPAVEVMGNIYENPALLAVMEETT